MTFSFLELLINFSKYLLFGVYFSLHQRNTGNKTAKETNLKRYK